MSKRRPGRAVAAFAQRAVELGAKEAKVVSTSEVFTGAWVRQKCRYGCGAYASSRNCPPYSPTPEQTRKVLDEFTSAILIHGDQTTDIRSDECDLEGPCRHAYKTRPAMEACGIDVFATARAAGFPLEVVTSRDCEQNYYGLVLVE